MIGSTFPGHGRQRYRRSHAAGLAGRGLASFGSQDPAPSSTSIAMAHVHRPAGRLGRHFLQDCDPEIQRLVAYNTARQSLAVLEQSVQSADWQQVASTYLVCAHDRGTPAELQREFAGRAGSVVELEAGHLSQPASVRDLVLMR